MSQFFFFRFWLACWSSVGYYRAYFHSIQLNLFLVWGSRFFRKDRVQNDFFEDVLDLRLAFAQGLLPDIWL